MFQKVNSWFETHKDEIESRKTVTIAVLMFSLTVSVLLNVSYDKLIEANHLEDIFYGKPTK